MKVADLAIGLSVAALGVLLLSGIGDIGAGAGFDRIGPRLVPYLVAAGLIVLGVLFAVPRPLVRRDPPTSHEAGGHPPPLQWVPLLSLGLSLLLTVLLLERVGFVLASTLQFWIAARSFHSRRPVRDGLIGLALSTVVYVAFARGLGLGLPQGLVEGLL